LLLTRGPLTLGAPWTLPTLPTPLLRHWLTLRIDGSWLLIKQWKLLITPLGISVSIHEVILFVYAVFLRTRCILSYPVFLTFSYWNDQQVQSNLARGGIAAASPRNYSFLFARWQQQFAIACFAWDLTPVIPTSPGFLTRCVIGPHKCTCQMASKCVERFKQGARLWQTTDLDDRPRRPSYGEMCSYRQNRLRCYTRFSLKTLRVCKYIIYNIRVHYIFTYIYIYLHTLCMYVCTYVYMYYEGGVMRGVPAMDHSASGPTGKSDRCK